MSEDIKGIIHLDGESEEFIKKATTGNEESLGVKLSMEWESDRVTCFLQDKEGSAIATLVFDNSDFQEIAEEIMPPTTEDLKEEEQRQEKMTESEKKEFEEELEKDMEDINKNPVKKEIEDYHKKVP